MTTLADLRARARAELGDTGVTPLWPDERLDAWAREGIRVYGRALPRSATLDLTSLAGQGAYPLPADVVAVVSVELPPGQALALARGAGPADAGGYRIHGGLLVLEPAPDRSGAVIRVRYAALYAEPAADADVLATPPGDDPLLVLAIAARALRWLWLVEAKTLRETRAAPPSLDLAARYEQAFGDVVASRRRALRTGRLAALGP